MNCLNVVTEKHQNQLSEPIVLTLRVYFFLFKGIRHFSVVKLCNIFSQDIIDVLP